MDAVIYIIAAPLFVASFGAYFYTKIRIKPHNDSDKDIYWEFEDDDPAWQRYSKWSKISFLGMAFSALMLFIASVI